MSQSELLCVVSLTKIWNHLGARPLSMSMGEDCDCVEVGRSPTVGGVIPVQVSLDCIRTVAEQAGEMVQCLRALDAPPENGSSIPSFHMVVHNHL